MCSYAMHRPHINGRRSNTLDTLSYRPDGLFDRRTTSHQALTRSLAGDGTPPSIRSVAAGSFMHVGTAKTINIYGVNVDLARGFPGTAPLGRESTSNLSVASASWAATNSRALTCGLSSCEARKESARASGGGASHAPGSKPAVALGSWTDEAVSFRGRRSPGEGKSR